MHSVNYAAKHTRHAVSLAFLIRSQIQVKPATFRLLIPLVDILFSVLSYVAPDTEVALLTPRFEGVHASKLNAKVTLIFTTTDTLESEDELFKSRQAWAKMHVAPNFGSDRSCNKQFPGYFSGGCFGLPCLTTHYVKLGKPVFKLPYRLGFSPQPQKNILVSHSRINPAPWKYLIYANPAQEFLPDRLRNTQKIPVFQSRTPKINRYFSCAQSPRRAKNDIFAR